MVGKRSKDDRTAPLFGGPIPKMPDGYYSGDKPNPNLRAFVEAHVRERPYDPETDDYDVRAFDKAIMSSKVTAIYNMHRYDSKKPHGAIREYILHYTMPGDLVLDPFCGSGGTALAAVMEGRKAIAIDRSPAATFIAKSYCTPVDLAELDRAFEELRQRIQPEMDWLYDTRCDRCGGKAITSFTVYSQVFECPRCMERVALFDCEEVEGETAAGRPKKVAVCPHCLERGIAEPISTRSEKFGAIPVLVRYECLGRCRPARGDRRHNDRSSKKREFFERYDLSKLLEIEGKRIPHWVPPHKMMNIEDDSQPWGFEWREGRNFRRIADLHTKRNLWALAAWRSMGDPLGTSPESLVCFAVTAMAKGTSRMCQYDEEWSFPYPIMSGTYYLPPIFKEPNSFKAIADKLDAIRKGLSVAAVCYPAWVSTQSATDLAQLPSQSIDYILTDPPYSDRVQYGELNFIWEAWLGFDTRWHEDEIIVNPMRGKTEDDWARMMRQAMGECHRVLKPGRWLSLCYHDTSEGTWALIQDIMAEVGFVADRPEGVLFIDTGQKSYNQLTADKVTKRDLVINYRKPRPGETAAALLLSSAEDSGTFAQRARAVIRDYLEAHPGVTKDHVYDHLVSRMVRRGAMEPHDFEALLSDVAEEVREPRKKSLFEDEEPDLFGASTVSRWYLKETALALVDAAETAKEDAAAESLAGFIRSQLRKQPHLEGVHYSDLFEHFLYAVADKPRRELKDWLGDYLFKTSEGTWRVPADTEEEQAKAAARVSGVSRRVRRYLGLLEQGVAILQR